MTALLISVFKLVAIVASAAIALATSAAKAEDPIDEFASTYVLTDLTVGYFTSDAPSTVTSVLLFAKSSFKFNADCVAILMGLFMSLVLSTFSNPKLVLAPTTVVALVPPFSIGTTPVTFSAFFAANAKGTVSNF